MEEAMREAEVMGRHVKGGAGIVRGAWSGDGHGRRKGSGVMGSSGGAREMGGAQQGHDKGSERGIGRGEWQGGGTVGLVTAGTRQGRHWCP